MKPYGIVANTVANVITTLLTYQLPTMLVQFSHPVSGYFIEWPVFPFYYLWAWPDDVVRPRPLRPSALCVMLSTGIQSTRRRKFRGGFLYGVYRPGE